VLARRCTGGGRHGAQVPRRTLGGWSAEELELPRSVVEGAPRSSAQIRDGDMRIVKRILMIMMKYLF